MRAEQKTFGKQVATAKGEEKAALVAQAKDLADPRAVAGVGGRASASGSSTCWPAGSATSSSTASRSAARRTTSSARSSGRRGTSRPRGSSRATTSRSASGSARSTWSAAPRCRARGSTSSPVSARGSSWRCSTSASPARSSYGFTPMITPTLVRPEIMAGAGFLDAHADEVYRLEADDLYLTGTSEVALAGYHTRRDPRPQRRPEAVCGVVRLLPAGGRLARQGHPRDHPRPPVPEDRDVRLLPARGRRGGARAAARLGARDARGHRGALPDHRHRRRRPRRPRGAQVRLRGVDAHPGPLPRADLDLELHDLPGPSAGRP